MIRVGIASVAAVLASCAALFAPTHASAQSFTPITPVVSTAPESCHVLKAAPGDLISAYVVNLTSTPGFLILLDAASVPADGAVTPQDVAILPANASASIATTAPSLEAFSTGIVACITSATTPFTKTTGTATGFFNGIVQ